MEGHRISVISVPVSNPDKAKRFYMEQLGFAEVMDNQFGHGLRWVTLRPPGAETAISLVTWFDSMPPGSMRGGVLSVPDIEAAVADLRASGAITDDQDIESAPWGRWVTVDDPDGNSWVVQEDAEGPIDFA
jgi:catechol 2,3-dioxygenase-like lactoylglutathione lyase family enzyme